MLRLAIFPLFLLCICFASLSGCGQTGTLYLPEEPASETVTPDAAADDSPSDTPADKQPETEPKPTP